MSKIAIVYNEPVQSRYQTTGEEKAVLGVLEAVNAVKKALIELHHEVSLVPLALPQEKAAGIVDSLFVDIVFNLFEGFPGYPETEAWLPDALLKRGIVFTGCPSETLKLALNKAMTKDLLRAAGISTPAHQLLTIDNLTTFHLQFPCIVKPMAEDASHGLSENSLVNDLASLTRQVKLMVDLYGGQALVEEFIDGREFNATVLGTVDCTVLPISEITYTLPPDKPKILTFAAKWDQSSIYYKSTPVVCPAKIDEAEKVRIGQVALSAFRIIGCWGYARVDMRLDRTGAVNVIEVNPNPDISPNTGAARQAKAAGMTYAQFIEKIVALANVVTIPEPVLQGNGSGGSPGV
jgi:D-alanine-D-alanine ligase